MAADKTRTHRPFTGACTALALVLTMVGSAGAQVAGAPPASAPRFTPRIVNGTLTSQYPAVGVLMDGSNPNTASMICSGTLIGCQTFLTAGHCVEGDLNPAHYAVFLQHAGFLTVTSVAMHPDYNFPVGDLAVIKLATPVTGIAPTPIDTTGVPFGTSGLIAGFGRSGGGAANADYGLKRVGAVTTAACTGGVSSTTSICWDFTNPLGPPGTDSNTCNGDSGGPLFIDFGAGSTIAGVTSGGSSATCLPTDNSYDANVFYYRAWIQAQGGADILNTYCGAIPQVGESGTNVFAASGQLSSAAPQGTHTFQVPAGTNQLRVALNAIDDGSSDFDLYVRRGSPPTSTTFDCKADGQNQYGFCQFTAPTPDTWYATVNRYAGSGTYQITVTTFGADCSDPGSNGAPCDDDNPCTQNDVCQAGACAGTPITNGTPCDDGNVCTQADTCQAGVCSSDSSPRAGCQQPFVPQKGVLRIEDDDLDQQAKLIWNWSRGTSTAKQDFGDPLSTTDYALCIYDQTAGVDSVIFGTRIPAGGTCGTTVCWNELTGGFRRSDRDTSPGRIKSLRLMAGSDGRARIAVRGEDLQLLSPLPLDQQSTVTVQLSNGAKCWEARYSTSITNTSDQFKAKAD